MAFLKNLEEALVSNVDTALKTGAKELSDPQALIKKGAQKLVENKAKIDANKPAEIKKITEEALKKSMSFTSPAEKAEQSAPFQAMQAVGSAYNTVAPVAKEGVAQILDWVNPVSNQATNELLRRVGLENPLEQPVKEFNRGVVSGGINKAVEQPAQAYYEGVLQQNIKWNTTPNKNMGDFINVLLGNASNAINTGMSTLPSVSSYNAIVGGLQGNESTKKIGDLADSIASFLPSVVAQGTSQLPISPEAQSLLNTGVNFGLLQASTKLGAKMQKGLERRVNSKVYMNDLITNINKNIAREGATFTSGPNFNPIIKALLEAEKKFVSNKVVQAIDPTGITTGAASVGMKGNTIIPGIDGPKVEPTAQTKVDLSFMEDIRALQKKGLGIDEARIEKAFSGRITKNEKKMLLDAGMKSFEIKQLEKQVQEAHAKKILAEGGVPKTGMPKVPDTELIKKINNFKTRFTVFMEDHVYNWKKLEKELGVDPSAGVYRAEALSHGRIGSRIRSVENTFTTLAKEMDSYGKTLEVPDGKYIDTVSKMLQENAQARHSIDYNRVHGDGAAGITNAKAAEVLKKYEGNTQIQNFTKRIVEANQMVLGMLEDSGYLKKEDVERMRATYGEYIPMNRIFAEGELEQGAGAGSLIKKAEGSERELVDVVGNTMLRLQRAIKTSERNIVMNKLYNLVEEAKGAGGLFEIVNPKVMVGADGIPSIIPFKEGEQILPVHVGGVQKGIKVNDKSLYKALALMTPREMNHLEKMGRAGINYMTAVATRYNPAFAPANTIRDVPEMVLTTARMEGWGTALKAAGRITQGQKGVIDYMRGKQSESAKYYKEMMEYGGTTGGANRTGTMENAKGTYSDWESIKKDLNGGVLDKSVAAGKKVLSAIDSWNTIFEDGTRLSVYIQMRKQGKTPEEAAYMAKESTINFDKKGEVGPLLSSIYAFANASIKGSFNSIRSLTDPKVGIPVTMAIAAATTTADKFNSMIDPDWDEKVRPLDREKGLVILSPYQDEEKDLEYMVIPLAYSLIPVKSFIDVATDVSKGKDLSPSEISTRLLSSLANTYNPIGTSAVPTVLRPFDDIKNNKNYAGIPLRKEVTGSKADSYFPSLAEKPLGGELIAGTKALQKATKGVIDFSPADIMYLYEQYTGGVGQFGEDVAGFTHDMFNAALGEDVRLGLDKTPILNRFFKRREEDQLATQAKRKEIETFFNKIAPMDEVDRNATIQKFLLDLPKEERASMMYIISQNGYSTKGISTSEKSLTSTAPEKKTTPKQIKTSAESAAKTQAKTNVQIKKFNTLIEGIESRLEEGIDEKEMVNTILSSEGNKTAKFDEQQIRLAIEYAKKGERMKETSPQEVLKKKIEEGKNKLEEQKK